MAEIGLEQGSSGLPIGFLRKVEALRRKNPQLLDLIEQSGGLRFPSELVAVPAPAKTELPSDTVEKRPSVRNSDAFASFRAGLQAGSAAARNKAGIQAPRGKLQWLDAPFALRGSSLSKLLRRKGEAGKLTDFGGPLPDSPASVVPPVVDTTDFRVTEDDLLRLTEDDLQRIIEG